MVSCEIIEAKDEKLAVHGIRGQQKPPFQRTGGHQRTLDDDINKLFEAVNLRASKSRDLSETTRNASKRPMRRPAGCNSPGIGFSEPVSLKQALRGLCISQAVEMAAIKRSSILASPRTSETGKIGSRYVVNETAESSQSPVVGGEGRIHISLVPEDANLICKDSEPFQNPHTTTKAPFPGSENDSSSSVAVESIVDHTSKLGLQKDCGMSSSACQAKDDEGSSESINFMCVPIESSAVSVGVASMAAAPEQRQRSTSQAVASTEKVKCKKGMKSVKIVSDGARPVPRHKTIVIKKAVKVASSIDRRRLKPTIVSKKGQDHASGLIICERCQCSMRDDDEGSAEYPCRAISVVKAGKALKEVEKCDTSQSSKSSAYGLSSSTTSASDVSNLSSFHCSNKPHMSKDIRWKAINHVIEKEGCLGLRHFNLLKKLGSGDIGTVYLAKLLGTSCQFAIKVTDNEFLMRRKKMPRAQTESEILKMLDHPFLPTLYAQFTSDNLSCLVLEFCPGGDLHILRQRQPRRCFPEHAARFYVAEVLLALEYLHMLGIVYRDLKPENILVREDGHIMLTDFDLSLICSVSPTLIKSSSEPFEPPRFSGQCTGSSCIDPLCTGPSCKVSCLTPKLLPPSSRARRQRGDHSLLPGPLLQLVAEPTEARSNSFVGTHEYLAPEIIKGEGHGSAVDWWTLGVFLYELLYGRTPFRGAGNEETLTNVVMKNLRFPETPMVSFHARDLIRRLLVKEPESRLGNQTGAGEIKRHPFFHGLNWALVRSATPPQVPENSEFGSSSVQETYYVYGANGEQLEFELF